MISAFTVYVVMQADTLTMMLALCGLGAMAFGVMFWMFAEECRNEAMGKQAMRAAIAGLFMALLAALTPNTKTLAAMLIVPEITSGEVIEMATPEARELYDLAKGALKSFGADKCPKEVEK